MAPPTLALILERVGKMEHRVHRTETLLRDVASRFCWYWRTETHKVFAVLSRLNEKTGRAELVAFDTGWSGGQDSIFDCEMFVADPLDEEKPKAEKWEPMIDMHELVEEMAALAAEKVAKTEAAHDEADSEGTAAA